MIGKSIILSVSVIAILVLSTVFAAIPAIPRASAQQKVPGADWEWVWYDGHGTNYSPQTQITKDNAQLLELKWLYPFPLANLQGSSGLTSGACAGRRFIGNVPTCPPPSPVGQGFVTMPLIVNGLVYVADQFGDVVAFSLDTGKEIWRSVRESKLPPNLPPGASPKHIHTMNYLNGKLHVPANIQGWGDVVILDPLTGKEVLRIGDIQKEVPGTRYPESDRYAMAIEYAPSLYKKGNVLIVPVTPLDFISRSFVGGYDASTGKLLWRWYVNPPAPDCKWEPKQANDARKGNIDPALAVGDWGTRCDMNGAGGPWGNTAVDEDKGIAYLGTTDPYFTGNATFRPGPTLYTNSIVALDAMTGELKWYYQWTPHSLGPNEELKEGTLLIKGATVKGEKKDLVVQTGRGIGVPLVLDADTGKLIYSYDRWEMKATGANPKKVPDTCENMGNECDMKRPWYQYPKTKDFEPHFRGNGGPVAYDPKTNAIFFYNQRQVDRYALVSTDIVPVPPYFPKGDYNVNDPALRAQYPAIAELVAMDLNTGEVKWKKESTKGEWAPARAGPVVTGGMVCGGASDGIVRCMDVATGKDIWTRSVGTAIQLPPTFGATTDGKMRMVQIFGGSGTGGGFPGGLMVFGLPDKLPEPQVITKEIIKEVPKEVVKEVIKEVPKEVIKEVTKTVTVETISPVSYAAIGIGVVLVVVAGVLFSRRKKV
ncbi:MAG: PQQ-binding-like beta-propeller repeat protein [Thaumarchaeota archaeon]|nr:PQQ-binding-like beta-propeller repeat protein [Nitrososphaerota archaeon]